MADISDYFSDAKRLIKGVGGFVCAFKDIDLDLGDYVLIGAAFVTVCNMPLVNSSPDSKIKYRYNSKIESVRPVHEVFSSSGQYEVLVDGKKIRFHIPNQDGNFIRGTSIDYVFEESSDTLIGGYIREVPKLTKLRN